MRRCSRRRRAARARRQRSPAPAARRRRFPDRRGWQVGRVICTLRPSRTTARELSTCTRRRTTRRLPPRRTIRVTVRVRATPTRIADPDAQRQADRHRLPVGAQRRRCLVAGLIARERAQDVGAGGQRRVVDPRDQPAGIRCASQACCQRLRAGRADLDHAVGQTRDLVGHRRRHERRIARRRRIERDLRRLGVIAKQ